MPWYRVKMHGENFFFDFDGKARRMGFYVSKFVEASGDTEARQRAIAQIHEDRRLGAQLEADDLATLDVDDVSEVDKASVPELPPELVLYAEQTND